MHVSIRFYLLSLLWMSVLWSQTVSATQWLTLKKNSQSTLMVDKQSIVEEAPYTKAWVKVEYRTPQKNTESVDRVYNNARALWYFECKTRKASTVQVFQYEDTELVYSAGIDAKHADFVEPLPESEVEIAQQYVCLHLVAEDVKADSKSAPDKAKKPVKSKPAINTEKNTAAKSKNAATAQSGKKGEAVPPEKQAQNDKAKGAKTEEKPIEKGKQNSQDKEKDKDNKDKKSAKNEAKNWAYQGEFGPEKWANISTDFHTCSDGTQQSPIALDNTITAALKPLKKLQKFPLTSMSRQQHGLSIDAGTGNMMVLDQQPYQLKTLTFHMPAEHQVKHKSYAAELQMLHEDKNKHRVIIAILFESGAANPEIEKLLNNLPKEGESSKALALRITPAALMPSKPAYYRYSGSLTTPPCDEGVQWIVMKEPLKMSPAQLQSLQTALGGANQRPLQDVRGRMILE